MTNIQLRPATVADHPAIVALNETVVALTSPMDEQRLADIVATGAMLQIAQINGEVAGFLMTLTDGSSYDSENYQWFANRLRRFLYIDRIVVAGQHRHAGVGGHFYRYAIELARQNNWHWLAAEMNIVPPNEASLAFHKKHGFVEIGEQAIGAGKTVSMQIRHV